VQVFDQLDVALQQLETALGLFEVGTDYFSVITLAGAAEEIFGKRLEQGGEVHSLAEHVKAASEIFRLLFGEEGDAKEFATRANRARNDLKRFRQDGTIKIDAVDEALGMLNRAVDNFWRLESTLTPSMERFTRRQHGS
jgi:hypothetical protein